MLRVVRDGQSSRGLSPPPAVAVVTQLSIDRLDRLEEICEVWGSSVTSSKGAVVAAILDEDRSNDKMFHAKKGNLSSKQLLRELEKRVDAKGVSQLTTSLVARSRCRESDLYPINSLRNIALSSTKSDFVLLLDVDCLPSVDSFDAICGTPDQCSALRRICIDDMSVVVLPCFEQTTPASDPSLHAFKFTSHDLMEAFSHTTACDLQSSISTPDSGVNVQPFMASRFAGGHHATDFMQLLTIWRNAYFKDDAVRHYYPIEYREGFEPYVVVARHFVPPYDELLEGYGRNKALHLYHLNRLGFKFVVSSRACLLHKSHEPTSDRVMFFQGSQRNGGVGEISVESRGYRSGQSSLMRVVKARYAEARDRITRECASWALDDSCVAGNMSAETAGDDVETMAAVGTACVYWPASVGPSGYVPHIHNSTRNGKIQLNKHWESLFMSLFKHLNLGDLDNEEISSDSQSISINALANYCAVHLLYFPPKLHIERCYLIRFIYVKTCSPFIILFMC
jgi:hypothetical protein